MQQLTDELRQLGAVHVVTQEQMGDRVARKQLFQSGVARPLRIRSWSQQPSLTC